MILNQYTASGTIRLLLIAGTNLGICGSLDCIFDSVFTLTLVSVVYCFKSPNNCNLQYTSNTLRENKLFLGGKFSFTTITLSSALGLLCFYFVSSSFVTHPFRLKKKGDRCNWPQYRWSENPKVETISIASVSICHEMFRVIMS